MLSAGVNALHDEDKVAILVAVKTFDAFILDNDPYGEHGFGSIRNGSLKVFWKIGCYDLNFRYGSEDPSDPTQTRRVMTIMLAEEY